MNFRDSLLKKSILMLLVIISTKAHALPDFLEPAKVAGSVKKAIETATIGGNLKLFNAEVYDGVTTALQYKIQTEPSYIDGYYTRYDRYKFKMDVSPTDWISGYDSPLGFSIHKNAEIFFARQFKTQKESITALPYTILNFPINSKRAIEKLNPGDFIAFQTDLNLVMSVGTATQLMTHLPLGASASVFVSGNFLVHMYRMPNEKLRVKFIAVRGKGAGIGVGSSYDQRLEIFGFKYLDKRITKWLMLNPLSLGTSKTNNDLFMIDLVFDLNSPEAALAYDNLVGSQFKFKELALTNPIKSKEQLKNTLVRDLTEVEDIIAQDESKRSNERRIEQIFKGSNSMTTTSNNLNLELVLFKFGSNNTYTNNKVVKVENNNAEKKFLFDTFDVTKIRKSLFNSYLKSHLISTSVLFKANEQFNPDKFVALALARELRFGVFDKGDLSDLKDKAKKTLPPDIYAQIDWKNWDFSKGSARNVFFRSEVFFKPEALEMMPNLKGKDAYELVRNYLKSHPRPKTNPTRNVLEENSFYNSDWVDAYEEDIKYIAKHLELSFDKDLSNKERYVAFIGLKDNQLFQEIGAGLLLSMLPEDKLNVVSSYQLILEGKNQPNVEFKFGDLAQEELYRNLIYIQRVLNNRSIDMRLVSEGTK